MKNQILSLRDKLSASYWFIPTVMAVLAVVLSITTIKLDEGIGRDIRWIAGLVYVDSPEGARAVLSTVASSMITVAGTVFSLTMVVLSLTSQQYGPLVLSHFMRDRGNQFVLGIFTATFLYCLLILRTIHGVESSNFVPHLSVLTGLGLSIASLAVLIYFIHHVSQSIQAPKIIARISNDLSDSIDDLFPDSLGKELTSAPKDQPQNLPTWKNDDETEAIPTTQSGYLQMIDDDTLLNIAQKHKLLINLDVLPGQFLYRKQTLVRLFPKQQINDQLRDEIQDIFIFGSQRTRTQDIEFTITQLSALAVRALSPGINDPFTAIMVIDHLGEALCTLLDRQPPSIFRYDEEDELRVIASTVTFEMIFHTAFDQIRHYGFADPKVAIRLLEVFKALWERADSQTDRDLLQTSIVTLYAESQPRLTSSEDQRFSQMYQDIVRDFQTAP